MLLSSYLQSSRDVSRIAVIVSDVGEVNIDGAILAVQDGVPAGYV
ncbi:GTP-binding protein [Cupriavidus basilensis]